MRYLSRHRIVAALRPGMATQNAFHAKPAALEDAIFLDRLVGICRAAGRVDTARRQQWAEEFLVEADKR